MNKRLLQSCLLLFILITVMPYELKEDITFSTFGNVRYLGLDYDYVYCQAGEHVVDRHVPRRDYKKSLGKGGGTLGDFEINYTGFTQEAQDAFQFAVDIWDMLLDSDAKIVVDANFVDLNSGTLGSAAPTAMYTNFSDKVDQDIEYAAPLAEKIAGVSFNGLEADLRCNFNSSANWFYDFNNTGNITKSQHDFVSVVLHELGHGLGFLSRNTLASTDGAGFIKADEPAITDIFSLLLELGDGSNLLLNFDEASQDLGSALTSENLFLNTHSFSDTRLPKIFAPKPWQGGSSLSHLDESTFNATGPLMTPSIGTNEIIHDPEIALDMLNDMGWRSSFIAHRANNSELVNQPVPIIANIYSDEGVGFDSTSVLLIYSQDSFSVSRDTVVLASEDTSSLFIGELPAESNTGSYQYYIVLADDINKGYSSPLLAPLRYHEVLTGIDNVPPEIQHEPIAFYFLNEESPVLIAEVNDAFIGVDTVVIEYRINGGSLFAKGLNNVRFDEYEFVLDLESLNPTDGDIIEYRLKATDHAMSTNESFAPVEGFFVVEVKDVPNAVTFYENDFEGSNIDFSNNGFSIRSEPNFDGSGLHSDHPYPNAGTGNELNLTAQLRVPIQVTTDAVIEFDEVVLVEPGETGSPFGSANFWDYVIVEVSEDEGTTWIPLTDGYDSSDKTIWNNRYAAGVSGQNSTSSGDNGLIQHRIIDLHQPSLSIDLGDEVILRWRLFSDPFAAGWGWMIDNLVIQGDQGTTPIVEYDNSEQYISIFPNPIVEDHLHYTVVGDIIIHNTMIFDSNGRLVLQQDDQVNYNDSRHMDIIDLPSGVYFAMFDTDKLSITKRFLKH